MASRTEIGARLAWRAKWRRRIKKYKTIITLAVLLAIGVPAVLAFTPWLPTKVHKVIDDNKLDPITGELRPESVYRMYMLAIFYESTMREEQAQEIYHELEKWYYGYSLQDWVSGAELDDQEPLKFPEEVKKYVGYAVFKHAEYQRFRGHGQWGTDLYRVYRDDFSEREDSDEKMNSDAAIHAR